MLHFNCFPQTAKKYLTGFLVFSRSMRGITLALAGVGLATANQDSAYAKVRHASSAHRVTNKHGLSSLSTIKAQIHRINTEIDLSRQKQQVRKSHAKVPTNLIGSSMVGGLQQPVGYAGYAGSMGQMPVPSSPTVGSYMPSNSFSSMGGGMEGSSYFPPGMSAPTFGGNGGPLGAGQIPQAAYPGQFNSTLGGSMMPGSMPSWGGAAANNGVVGSHPFASPAIQRPLYMDMNVAPSYWSQASPNSPIGLGLPSMLEINSRARGDDGGYYLPPASGAKPKRKRSEVYETNLLQTSARGDEGQAYWLPPASGDESAGGGGGAAPASPGTSQYSVSPQAFYQGGGAAGGGAAAPASLLEIMTRNFPQGTHFATKEPFSFQHQGAQLPMNNQGPPMNNLQGPQRTNDLRFQSQPQGFGLTAPPSLSDPANSFDQMHQSWIPTEPKQAAGTITPANSGTADGLTGAGFMSLADPGGSSSPPPQLRRL